MKTHEGRKNLKKMVASLSALGAGALLGASGAEAGVVYSGPLNVDVGFGPNADPSGFYYSGPLGPFGSDFSFQAVGHATKGVYSRGVIGSACGCFGFLTQSSFLKLVGVGAQWPQTSLFRSYHTAKVGRRLWGKVSGGNPSTAFTAHNSDGVLGNFNDKFALFAFHAGPDTYYGWIQLSFSMSPGFGADPAFGPDLIIQGWAYGDANELLPAGTVPEPATVGSTGLAALALGAVGLRSWRRTRKAA